MPIVPATFTPSTFNPTPPIPSTTVSTIEGQSTPTAGYSISTSPQDKDQLAFAKATREPRKTPDSGFLQRMKEATKMPATTQGQEDKTEGLRWLKGLTTQAQDPQAKPHERSRKSVSSTQSQCGFEEHFGRSTPSNDTWRSYKNQGSATVQVGYEDQDGVKQEVSLSHNQVLTVQHRQGQQGIRETTTVDASETELPFIDCDFDDTSTIPCHLLSSGGGTTIKLSKAELELITDNLCNPNLPSGHLNIQSIKNGLQAELAPPRGEIRIRADISHIAVDESESDYYRLTLSDITHTQLVEQARTHGYDASSNVGYKVMKVRLLPKP